MPYLGLAVVSFRSVSAQMQCPVISFCIEFFGVYIEFSVLKIHVSTAHVSDCSENITFFLFTGRSASVCTKYYYVWKYAICHYFRGKIPWNALLCSGNCYTPLNWCSNWQWIVWTVHWLKSCRPCSESVWTAYDPVGNFFARPSVWSYYQRFLLEKKK